MVVLYLQIENDLSVGNFITIQFFNLLLMSGCL